jgi:NCS1 family nucleobase:cation symporter-1
VDRDERLHSDLSARLRIDRRRDELVAGDRDHPARQPDRAGADAAQRTRGHEVRNSVSGAGARIVRRARANIPAVLRALVACGWFGIQTWIGGKAIFTMLAIVWPAAGSSESSLWICFFAFWALNMYVVWRGIETIKILESITAPFMLMVAVMLLWWVTSQAGGLGPVFRQPSKFQSNGEFFKFFVPSLTGMVGFWSTVALNIPDFTRYAKSQRDQAWGQALGLPPAMTIYSFIAVAVTSASSVLFGKIIWDPVELIGKFNKPVVALIALIALLIATLNTNVAANVVSPSNDFSNLNPRRISFRTGGLITGVLGIAMMPWKLLSDFSAYIFGWLVGYSGLLGPIAGVMIADYFVIRKRQLNVDQLYRSEGEYTYTRGVNWRAVGALLIGVAVALLGLVIPAVRWMYDYAWFVGFIVAGAAYVVLDEEGVCMIATDVRTLKFYVDGKWEDAAGSALHP